jgi:hypothetical protein
LDAGYSAADHPSSRPVYASLNELMSEVCTGLRSFTPSVVTNGGLIPLTDQTCKAINMDLSRLGFAVGLVLIALSFSIALFHH